MQNTFDVLSGSSTPLDEFNDFDIINYSTISDTKATRLLELRQKTYPERFVLEVIEKCDRRLKYNSSTFKTLQDALDYQNSLAQKNKYQ